MIKTKFNETNVKRLKDDEAKGNVAISQLNGTIKWPFVKDKNRMIELELRVKVPETGRVTFDQAVKQATASAVQPILKRTMEAVGVIFDEVGKQFAELEHVVKISSAMLNMSEEDAWKIMDAVDNGDEEKEQSILEKLCQRRSKS